MDWGNLSLCSKLGKEVNLAGFNVRVVLVGYVSAKGRRGEGMNFGLCEWT